MKKFVVIWYIWAVICLSLVGLAIWAIVHFVSKYW